ncbi:LrgB family protein [Halomonas tibetensis]|uniref:LrgB family protein n=1 Tax=Halomonas tibetensis TaxID=2259590 RepID=A0ABV7B4Y0_9GAMM
MSELLDHLLATPLLAIALTLAAYFAGDRLFRLVGAPAWCPPILVAALLLAGVLALLGIDYSDYREGAGWLMLLLGPATVALGLPLYQQMGHIRAMWRPLLVCLPISALMAAFYAVGIAWLLNAPLETLASLAPKSVTAPIAIGITEQLGGSVSLMMGGLLLTGVATIGFVDVVARWLKIRDPRLLGLALGINGHALGTVRAFEIGPTAGAFASLGMSLTGILTALLLPLAWKLPGLVG